MNAVRALPDSVSRHVVDDMKALLTVTSNQAAQLANHFVSADGTGRIAIICPNDLIKPVREAVRHRLSSADGPIRISASYRPARMG